MMRIALLIPLFLAGLTGPAAAATGRITGTSLHEIQAGKVPFADSTNHATAYNQINADYLYRNFQAGVRAEVYRSSASGRSVTYLTHRYARWANGPLELVAGNYFGILGRGLTLRAFETAGVVLESAAFRRRYSPSRDLEGGMARFSSGIVEAKALLGRPVDSELPPGIPDVARRTMWTAGGSLEIRPVPELLVGGTAVNLRPPATELDPSPDSWAWSWLAGLDVTRAMEGAGLETGYGSIYGEFAQRAGARRDGHARYLSTNVGIGEVGVSVEWKDYENFGLAGVNDPPPLVREHTSYLLNRNTHVSEPLEESGWQIEGYIPLVEGVGLISNVSWAKNQVTPTRAFHFDERYVQLDVNRFEGKTLQAFFALGREEIDARVTVRTGGILLSTTTPTGHRFELTAEGQRGKLGFGQDPWYWDSYGTISWQSPLGFGATLALDRSTDPNETDRPETLGQIETDPVSFLSLNLNAQVSRFDFVLFAGERRGGTACTSGTCYQVLPFRGIELRVTTRL